MRVVELDNRIVAPVIAINWHPVHGLPGIIIALQRRTSVSLDDPRPVGGGPRFMPDQAAWSLAPVPA